METNVSWGGTGPCQSFHMLKNSILTTYRRSITSPSTCISTISFNSSQGNRIAKADVVSQFVVGSQHHKICRDKLINVNGGLVAACSNQQGKNHSSRRYQPITSGSACQAAGDHTLKTASTK